MPFTFHVEHFGCRAARADGEAVSDRLRAAGHCMQQATEADVVIVNTCSVTAEADRAARAFIRRAHASDGRDLLVVNCMAGVSRSGAVATFAMQACGGSRDLFAAMNPHVVPNAFVGRLLRESWAGIGTSAFEVA